MNALWRILFRFYRTASWLRYQAARKFTKLGLLMFAAWIITGSMCLDMESFVAYQAFTLSTGLLLVAVFFGGGFRAKFSVARQFPRFGTAGESFEYQVILRNLSGRAQAGLVLLEDMEDSRPAFAEWKRMQLAEQRNSRPFQISRRRSANPFKLARIKEASVPVAQPNGGVEVQVQLTPLRRGVLRFKSVTLARPDPLGLFRGLQKIPVPQTVLILPKRYLLPPVALPGMMKYQDGGVALASSVGQSEEFVSLRDYRRGDPIRHIHWRSWARTGKPIIKEFADEFFVRHALVLDTFDDNPHSEAFEEAVSVAASFACAIQTQESLLDLLFVGAEAYCFTAGRGLAHADQMLEILASVNVCTDKPFDGLETLVMNHSSVVSGCVCVLLAWDETRKNFVEKLKASGVPVLVVVVLPSEPAKPLDPGPMRDEQDKFHTVIVGKIEEGLARL